MSPSAFLLPSVCGRRARPGPRAGPRGSPCDVSWGTGRTPAPGPSAARRRGPRHVRQPRASPFRRCRLATASTLRLVRCPHALLGGDSGGWGGTLTQRVPTTRDNDSLCDVEDTGRSVRRHHTAHACAGPGVNVLGTRKHHSRVDHGSLGARGGVTRTFAYLFRTG